MRPRTLTATGLGCAAVFGVLAAAQPGQDPRLDGEYGLYVGHDRDSLVVQWLTAEAAPGVIEASWTGGSVRTTTPAGRMHAARFAAPRTGEVVLRYGAAGGTVHETRLDAGPPRRPAVEYRGVDSLYIVGDTHGDYDALLTGLRRAGLIDDTLRWSGGRRHLVFAGDLTDRGPDVMRLLWFVYALARDAERAGGRVHVLLGNHETMVMMGDLRYLHPKDSLLAELHGMRYDRLLDIRHTVLGRWLASRPALIRIDGALIAHGGVAPEFAELSLRGFDDLLARYMAEDLFYTWAQVADTMTRTDAFRMREDFFLHPRSTFWHRGYVQSDSAGAELTEVLGRLGAELLVVAHTPVPVIDARYDGRLLAVHTPRFGAELLLLVRSRGEYQRFRITGSGAPEPF